LDVGVSPKLIRLKSGVEEEVRNVDSGRVPVFTSSVANPKVYWPVLDDVLEADAEFVEAVDAEDEGA
jgi:hypothetical protein